MKLKDLCRTLWVQRIDSYTVFHDLYQYIIITMECICSVEYSQWTWDTQKQEDFFISWLTPYIQCYHENIESLRKNPMMFSLLMDISQTFWWN